MCGIYDTCGCGVFIIIIYQSLMLHFYWLLIVMYFFISNWIGKLVSIISSLNPKDIVTKINELYIQPKIKNIRHTRLTGEVWKSSFATMSKSQIQNYISLSIIVVLTFYNRLIAALYLWLLHCLLFWSQILLWISFYVILRDREGNNVAYNIIWYVLHISDFVTWMFHHKFL